MGENSLLLSIAVLWPQPNKQHYPAEAHQFGHLPGRLIRFNVCPIAEFVSWTMDSRDKIESFPPMAEPLSLNQSRCSVRRRVGNLSAVFGACVNPPENV